MRKEASLMRETEETGERSAGARSRGSSVEKDLTWGFVVEKSPRHEEEPREREMKSNACRIYRNRGGGGRVGRHGAKEERRIHRVSLAATRILLHSSRVISGTVV